MTRAFGGKRWPCIHGLVLVIVSLGVFCSAFLPSKFALGADVEHSVSGLSLPGVGAAPSADHPDVVSAAVLPRTVQAEYEPTEAEPTALEDLWEEDDVILTAAVASAQTAPAPTETAEPASPLTLYEVQEGDTVSGIAAAFGVSTQYVIWNNADLQDDDVLLPGQIIMVPAEDGVIHEVRLGETLSDIAARYDADLQAITDSPFNALASADDIVEAQVVFVPEGIVWTAPPEEEAEAGESAEEPTGELAEEPGVAAVEPVPEEVAPVVTGPASGAGLIWPVVGPISSYYGPSHPLGIDIDLFNNPNAPIGAATSGVVTFAGGDPCCSYGLYVVVVSPEGIETLYAHFSSISVVQGQEVVQGQVLGYGGCTGYCTGNHLHFEVIDNGVRQNPLSYLP
jgi:murein DD-endopeptidase MepM/ murein hydrolase activator NlpD